MQYYLSLLILQYEPLTVMNPEIEPKFLQQ